MKEEYIIAKSSTNEKYHLDYVQPLTIEQILEELGESFQNLRHLAKYAKTVEKGGWRARGFSKIPPHHHKTVSGKTPNEALENLWKAVQYK